MNNIDNKVTFIIKTFERIDNIRRILKSISKLSFKSKVIVADDSTNPTKDIIVSEFPELELNYIVLPFDTGLSKGRNIMLEQVNTPYFFLCDDDYIFTDDVNMNFLIDTLDNTDIDILGSTYYQYLNTNYFELGKKFIAQVLLHLGILVKPKSTYNFFGSIVIKDAVCYYKKIEYQHPFTYCDFVLNCFLAKTASFKKKNLRWKEELKMGEHEHFFIDAKSKNAVVATTYKSNVFHVNPLKVFKYKKFRSRDVDYRKMGLKDLGIKKVIGYEEVTGYKY